MPSDNLYTNWETAKPGYADLRNAERNAAAQELFGKRFGELTTDDERLKVAYHVGGLHKDFRAAFSKPAARRTTPRASGKASA